MPAMPRPSKKAEKIAFSILGKPDSFYDDETERQKEIKRKLNAEDTYLSRT